PQWAPAALAEVSASRAARTPARVFVQQTRAIHGDILLALDAKRSIVSTEIDGVPACSGGLAADRAVTAHEGIGMRGLDMESHGAAVARAFEAPHGHRSHGLWKKSLFKDGGFGLCYGAMRADACATAMLRHV